MIDRPKPQRDKVSRDHSVTIQLGSDQIDVYSRWTLARGFERVERDAHSRATAREDRVAQCGRRLLLVLRGDLFHRTLPRAGGRFLEKKCQKFNNNNKKNALSPDPGAVANPIETRVLTLSFPPYFSP